ncbi:unnamed protein product [Arabis nemorensis]|uniref:Uncharacterized protein n=1 Tax=Arabis nemorensis TaxID=586526 RepID=A0A565B6W9_9BRAS|nr:unnamed protein product [Arabis nemorensis]
MASSDPAAYSYKLRCELSGHEDMRWYLERWFWGVANWSWRRFVVDFVVVRLVFVSALVSDIVWLSRSPVGFWSFVLLVVV